MNTHMHEQFKSIENYSNYQVSNLGKVVSVVTGKTMIGAIDKGGYQRIGIRDDGGKRNYFYVHRLVAYAFVDNPNNYDLVEHITEDVKNNCYDNLQWITQTIKNRRNKMQKINTSGVVGVSKNKHGTFVASIYDNDKKRFSKSFKTLEEAAAWREAHENLMGGFL